MNETLRQMRLSSWAHIIAQCNRESEEQNITKLDWMKAHGVNPKSFYRKQKEVRELLIDSASTGSELPQALKPSSSFVEVPLVRPAKVSGKTHANDCHQTASAFGTPADLVIRYGEITLEISNNASGELLAFAKRVLRDA